MLEYVKLSDLGLFLFIFSAYGHNYLGERYVPVLLKDVAGLVPGARDGKGRGNRYVEKRAST